MQKLSDPDLLNWAREILVALKSWTLAGEDERLAIQYNELGGSVLRIAFRCTR